MKFGEVGQRLEGTYDSAVAWRRYIFFIMIGFQESFQETATVARGFCSVSGHLGL